MPRVRRVDFGYFVRPGSETPTGKPRVEALLGYAVSLSNGVLLFDTGLAQADAETEARYRPVRRPSAQALRSAGVDAQEIRWIVNCHLHFDHCGGNPHLPGRPIFVQAVELERARTVENYTLPEVIDFPNARYEQVDGESEILPDVFLIPTPGHTEGHQVLAVRQPDGTIILAGQAFNTAFDFGSDYLAWRAQRQDGFADDSIAIMPWMDRLIALDPRRILFAHDFSVWEPAGRPAEDASAANG